MSSRAARPPARGRAGRPAGCLPAVAGADHDDVRERLRLPSSKAVRAEAVRAEAVRAEAVRAEAVRAEAPVNRAAVWLCRCGRHGWMLDRWPGAGRAAVAVTERGRS